MRDLNDLSLFAAVVSNGGFSAAARALGTPKSRVSRRVANLEQQLGVRLVERSTRRFKVTEVGHDVYRHARAAMCEAEAVDEVVSRVKAEPQGLVRVSCPLGVDRVLGAVLPEFLRANPKLRVQVLVTNRRVDIIEEGVDVAIRIREQLDSDADLQVRIVGRTGAWLVASAAFVAENGAPQSPEEIANFPTISHAERPGVDRWALFNAQGDRVEVAHEPRVSATDWSLIRSSAIGGLGIALLPEYLANEPLRTGEMVRLLPDWTRGEGIIHLVFTSRRGLLPGVRAVIDFAAEALHPRSPVWESMV
ncbi:MAG TPA: LysR substrate-binding domain-containing protein [Caulobacteraceae bacterium]|jgi:DNA-binding transcriptional LysR family regulator